MLIFKIIFFNVQVRSMYFAKLSDARLRSEIFVFKMIKASFISIIYSVFKREVNYRKQTM